MNSSGQICCLTDDPTMSNPLKLAKWHFYPTNMDLADRLLLSELRLPPVVVEKRQYWYLFEAVFEKSSFHPLENHQKMCDFTCNSPGTFLRVCLTILSSEKIDEDGIVTLM